jgi:hypothetical protein
MRLKWSRNHEHLVSMAARASATRGLAAGSGQMPD